MGLRTLEVLQGVGVGARVVCVLLGGHKEPAKGLLELAEGVQVVTEHVPELTLGDELVQERLSGGRHVPPALTAAVTARLDVGGGQAGLLSQPERQHVLLGVAEVALRGQSARGEDVGAVALGVAGEELHHALASLLGSAACLDRLDLLTDGETAREATRIGQIRDEQPSGDRGRKRRRSDWLRIDEGVRLGQVVQM